jgi:hypothetical protein
MEWVYDITGAEPILRDMPVYDAATLAKGELLMLGTTDPDSNADQGQALITAYNSTAANSAIDAVGILNDDAYDSALGTGNYTAPSSVPATATNGAYYGKVIINPFAIYRAEHSLLAADDVAITSTSTTTLTVGSLSDDIDGCYAYFPLTDDGVKGSLRYIVAAASGSCTMDSALTTTGDSSDTVCIIAPALKYATNLTADGTKVASGNCQGIFGATNIRILESYIDRDRGIEPLRKAKHSGLNGLDNCKGGNGPKFYSDIMLKDHAYGVQE